MELKIRQGAAYQMLVISRISFSHPTDVDGKVAWSTLSTFGLLREVSSSSSPLKRNSPGELFFLARVHWSTVVGIRKKEPRRKLRYSNATRWEVEPRMARERTVLQSWLSLDSVVEDRGEKIEGSSKLKWRWSLSASRTVNSSKNKTPKVFSIAINFWHPKEEELLWS